MYIFLSSSTNTLLRLIKNNKRSLTTFEFGEDVCYNRIFISQIFELLKLCERLIRINISTVFF